MEALKEVGEKPAGPWAEWRRGWKLVLASAVGFSFFSVLLAGTGLFFEPLRKEFGWNRSLLSAGPAIATLVTALLSPFYGALIDRVGSRRLALPGIVMVMASMSAFAFASGSRAQWIVLWVIFGILLTTIKSTVWTTAVAGMFDKGRGLALGMTVAGTAVAQAVVPPLGNFLIEHSGWRGAFIWFALGWGGLTLLLCMLFLYDAHDNARRAALKAGKAEAADQALQLPGLSLREALRSRAIWQLAASTFVVMGLTVGLGIHLFPILTEAGVSRASAAWLTGLSGLAGIVGKLVTGLLMDRYRSNWIGGVTMGITAVTFLVLIWWIDSSAALIFGLLVNGYAAGTKMQICAFLTAAHAGMRHFGAIYGAMSALVAFASGLGPWLAGVVYDTSGDYGPFLWAGVVGCIVSGALLVTLPRYPEQSEARA